MATSDLLDFLWPCFSQNFDTLYKPWMTRCNQSFLAQAHIGADPQHTRRACWLARCMPAPIALSESAPIPRRPAQANSDVSRQGNIPFLTNKLVPGVFSLRMLHFALHVYGVQGLGLQTASSSLRHAPTAERQAQATKQIPQQTPQRIF